MRPGESLRGRSAGLAALTVLVALAAAPTGASALPAVARDQGGVLSHRLTELAEPAVRALPRAGQARRLGVARHGPASLLRRGGRVVVEIRFEGSTAAPVEAIRAGGIEVLDVSEAYRTVTAAAFPAELERLRAVPGVTAVEEVLMPLVRAGGPVASAYVPCFGAETSEGDAQVRAAAARTEFGLDGSGVTVGILSDSFDRDPLAPTAAAEDVLSGDLPGPDNPCGLTSPVEVLEEGTAVAASDEGRAMAQIVHDLAPGARIAFATAFNGEIAFAESIRDLAAAGADAIVDDVSYFEEPFFQEGPVAVAVADVTEGDDVAYFTAAGNDNLIDAQGSDIGSWEAPAFRDSGNCPAAVAAFGPLFNPSHCLDFNPLGGVDRTFGIAVAAGETLILDLQWAEPWNGVTTDLDAFLLDAGGGEVLAESFEDNVLEGRPLEILVWENETDAPAVVQLAINRFAGGTPRLKFVLLQNGGGVTATEYPKSAGGDVVGPTIFGHNGAGHAMSVGAIRFNTTSAPESFSSRGPVTHYFGPVTGVAPAAPLASPEVLSKPDVVASDGGANTFFGVCAGGAWRFFGTSAAAPHAAAVAALAREAAPAAGASEVKEAQREAADPVGAFPPTAVGAGLLDAVGMLEALGLTPSSPGVAPVQPPPAGPCLQARAAPPLSAPAPGTGPSGGAGIPPPAAGSADLRRPGTFFRRRPPRVIRTGGRRARVVFRFGSDEAAVSFACRVDGAPFRPCRPRFARRFAIGRHVVRVVARDAAGNVDATPAVHRFRVVRRGA